MSEDEKLAILMSMGYSKEQSEKAIQATNDQGLQAALQWLQTNVLVNVSVEGSNIGHEQSQSQSQHPQSLMQAKASLSSGENVPLEQKGKPLHEGFLCDGCKGEIYGIRYRCLVCDNYDLCETCEKKGVHIETEHNFQIIEKPIDITQQQASPLTEEEKKQVLERLQEKIRHRREQKRKEEERAEIERERKRRLEGKEAQAAMEKWKEQQAIKEAERIRREKEEEKRAKELIRKKIEQDKLERQAQQRREISQSQSQQQSQSQSQPKPPPTTQYNECILQIRLTNGSILKGTFKPTDTINTVLNYIEKNRTDDQGPFQMMTTFPKKVFTAELLNTTLLEAGLVPRGTLVISKI